MSYNIISYHLHTILYGIIQSDHIISNSHITFSHTAILYCIIQSYYHAIMSYRITTYYHVVIPSYYQSIKLSNYQAIILSHHHATKLPHHHTTTLPYYHTRAIDSVRYELPDYWRLFCRRIANHAIWRLMQVLQFEVKQHQTKLSIAKALGGYSRK